MLRQTITVIYVETESVTYVKTDCNCGIDFLPAQLSVKVSVVLLSGQQCQCPPPPPPQTSGRYICKCQNHKLKEGNCLHAICHPYYVFTSGVHKNIAIYIV